MRKFWYYFLKIEKVLFSLLIAIIAIILLLVILVVAKIIPPLGDALTGLSLVLIAMWTIKQIAKRI